MTRFNKILYVVAQPTINPITAELVQRIASDHDAELTVAISIPAIQVEMQPVMAELERSLTESVKKIFLETVARPIKGLNIQVIKSTEEPLQVQIIRKVLGEGFDLVMKTSELLPNGTQGGFPALDMNLLRQCPCPLWLVRPDGKAMNRIAVAIDPNEQESAGRELSMRLLRLAEALSKYDHTEVQLLSCWQLEHEYFLRNSPFGKIPVSEIETMAQTAKSKHEESLSKIIQQAGIQSTLPIHLLKGHPGDTIPQFLEENGINLLVMGTVARTGIPGFIIGNTAESIVQTIRCSMLAVKPQGFISPVTL